MPTFAPLTCHWKAGKLPPFEGVALKVTDVPAQIGVWLATNDTAGVTLVAVMVMGELTALGVEEQGAVLVRFTVTTSPSASVVVV